MKQILKRHPKSGFWGKQLERTIRAIAIVAMSFSLPSAMAIAQNDQDGIDRILAVCEPAGNGQIPSLSWSERSDWINVKSDVTPAAKGDGIADDTEAIQAALDRIGERPGRRQSCLFPCGQLSHFENSQYYETEWWNATRART